MSGLQAADPVSHFQYHNGRLYADGLPLSAIAADHGTPAYVYSRAAIVEQWNAYHQALADRPHLICYAVKANSNLAILSLLAELGSGFDIVSVGELERVLRAGGEAGKVVFSGVGKRRDEMERALQAGIHCFNVESLSELQRLDQVAGAMGLSAPVSLRVNPDVNADTHPYISTGLRENKFGIAYEQALDIYRRAQQMAHIRICGIDCHIGSQITALGPYVDALGRIMELVEELARAGIELAHIDIGGGLGIRYQDETPPSPGEFIDAIAGLTGNGQYELMIEPGRSIVGNAAVLLTRVEYLKQNGQRNFAIVDAAMNDLIRPALYDAELGILPVQEGGNGHDAVYDIVGPVCESADFLGLNRRLAVSEGDLLAIMSAGAYSFSMSSNYNSRPRPVEILVEEGAARVIRERESLESLMLGENC